MLDGCQPGDPIVRVFTYQAVPVGSPEEIAEEAFATCSDHPRDACGEELARPLLRARAAVAVLPRKLTVLRQVVLCSQSRRVAQIVVEAVGRANVLRASARHREVTPMTDKISQQPVPPLDPPERFAGGEVVAAARCPVDVSTYPRRHVIVVKHAGERQTFSVHEVAHNHVEWVGGQGHYKLGYAAAIRLMAEKVVGRA
jgi:hypothetical protein